MRGKKFPKKKKQVVMQRKENFYRDCGKISEARMEATSVNATTPRVTDTGGW
jgi:hypothetical protein